MHSEKRRNRRLQLDLACLHGDFHAQINDVSVSGIQFVSKNKLKTGTITEIKIIVPENDFNMFKGGQERNFRLNVKVMWCRKQKEDTEKYVVGAEIITSIEKTEKLFLAYLLDKSGEKFAHLDQKLLEMEAYKTLAVNATYPILVVQNEEIAFINPACSKLLGHEEEESIGKKFIDLLSHADKEIIREKIDRHLSAKKQKPYMLTLTRKGGEHADVEIRSKNIQYRDQPAVMHILRDITEIKILEQQLIRAEKLKVLGEITSGVSHNFNNILGIILGRSQLLQCHLDNPDFLQKGLSIIEKAAWDGSEITKRLQDSARVRIEPPSLSMIDINEIIKDVIDFTRTKWKDEAEAKGIAISVKTSLAELSLVAGNASELREVFINLVFNSIDAMPIGGQIDIKTDISGEMISVAVSDNGEGMPEEVKTKVFDPFFTTKPHRGTGLGMSLSFSIVSRHSGEINVESVEGEGTTFTILLPIRSEAEKVEMKGGATAAPAKLETANILVVDDEEDIREIFFDLFTSHNHRVSLASDGKEALELFNTGSYDIVITDLGMPGMSGLELASAIKDVDPTIPVVLLTGWHTRREDEKFTQRNIDYEIAKPCKLNQVLDIVAEAMKLKKPGSAIDAS